AHRKAFVAEKGWVDSPGEVAELGDRLLDLVLCAREYVGCGRVGPRGFEAERYGKGHEPLLRTVVEVALDAATLGVACGDDPAARRAHLRELRAHIRREALILQHKGGRRANRLDQRRLVEQRW